MLFPEEFINRSVEHLFHRTKVRSKLLYSFTLLFIVLIFASLPFIVIDIGKSSAGMVVPVSNKVLVVSSNSGLVNESLISENEQVEKGQLLISFQTEAVDQQLEKNLNDQKRSNTFIQDLSQIIQSIENDVEPNNIQTYLYQSEWSSFKQEMYELEQGLNNQQQVFNRVKSLHQKGIVSKAEFEQNEYELSTWFQRVEMLTQHQLNVWQSVLNNLNIELDALQSNEAELLEIKKLHYVYAPISGTLQNTIGISSNSVLYTNQLLAEISPDTTLIAEVYVIPSNIGFIEKGMPVRFQIDAFNYNEWGFLEGEVTELPNDAVVTESGEVMFVVRCSFSSTTLELANGYRASLRKGMTLQSQFLLTQRSLFQLLYDNVDDWLNPIRNGVVN